LSPAIAGNKEEATVCVCGWSVQDSESYRVNSELLSRHQHLEESDAADVITAWLCRHDSGVVTAVMSSL